MKEYIKAAENLDDLIRFLTPEDVDSACKLMDRFWKDFCETDVQVFWFVRWTRHDHAAKGAWAQLDFKLRNRLKELQQS